MFKLFGKVMKDEKVVKAIFDHYKNFAVAAVIIAIGIKVFGEEQGGFLWWAPTASGSALIFTGVVLLILNERHGMYLLEKAGLPRMQHLLLLLLYGLSTIVLIGQLILVKYSGGA